MTHCKKCGAQLLPKAMACAACGVAVEHHRKRLMWVVAATLGLAYLVLTSKSDVPTKTATATSMRGTFHHVTYEVTSSARVTYANEQGGIQQEEVPGGWTKTITVRPGAFVSISAQNDSAYSNSIVASIKVDGQPFRQSESSGRYAIAAARGTCCDR